VVVVRNDLRRLRDERGLTRRVMAADLGITEATLFRYETFRQSIPDPMKLRLARYFDVPVHVLMAWPADRPPE
jgi:transcriptional regulator with XRE-family HTH domain